MILFSFILMELGPSILEVDTKTPESSEAVSEFICSCSDVHIDTLLDILMFDNVFTLCDARCARLIKPSVTSVKGETLPALVVSVASVVAVLLILLTLVPIKVFIVLLLLNIIGLNDVILT